MGRSSAFSRHPSISSASPKIWAVRRPIFANPDSLLMSATLKPTLRERLFVALQHALPQHFLSRVVLRVTRIRLWPVKNLLIKSFVRGFKPNMTEATQPNPLQYPSFNAFFTRTLRPGARQIDLDPGVLVSPVDGTVSQI